MSTSLIDRLSSIDGAPEDMFEQRDDVPGSATGGDDEDDASYGEQAAPDRTQPIPGGGKLLAEPSAAKVFKSVDREVMRQERLAKNRNEAGTHWSRIRKGVQFSILEKSEDQSIYRAVLPPGVEDVQQPIPNKVLDLSNKQVSQILVDPPLPNPKADGDNERNRSAMDLAKRFLRADGDTSGTNDMELFRTVLNTNRTRRSGFVYVWVDPSGGGWRPKQLMAHPRATDPSNPRFGPELDPTGQPVLDANGQPRLERTTDPVLRYVGEDNTFVDDAAAAAREWLPKHKAKTLHPNQVRTLPPSATVAQSHSLILLMWAPLAEARLMFPDALNGLSSAELRQLTVWKPRRWKSIVPESQRPKNDGLGSDGAVSDDTLLFWYHKFCRISPDYPDGAEIAVSGSTIGTSLGVVLVRDTLREDVQQDDGTTIPVLMEPPVAQFRALIDDQDSGDPFGMEPVSLYGGANETRAHLYLAALEDIDVRLHPNTYLTSFSTIKKEDMNRRDGTPLQVQTKEDMPTFEQRPELPAHLPEFLERVDRDMERAANLNETAQGLDSSYSASGEAKKVALRQAKVQLAQDWQGFIDGVVQFWKIKLQLAQARLKTPMLVKLAGENSAYKARHFVGADLLGVSTVALQPGTGTMMSPAEKAQYLAQAQGAKWLDESEAEELFRSAMSDDLGLQPTPHEEHIDRCIADWCDGPPKDWLQQFSDLQSFPQRQQQYTATLQQTVAAFTSRGVDPTMAQQAAAQHVGPAPTQPAEPKTPFEARANDEEPIVAKVRYQKLSKLISTTEYSEQPPEWRTCVDKAYQQAAYAAGVQTVRQQQQAQAAAQQAAQQAEAQKAQGKADPNAPPVYQQFLATVQNKVIGMVEQMLAREISALGESKDVAEKPLPVPVPETIGPDPTHPLDLAHASMEKERDRAHDVTMAGVEHDNTMAEIKAQNVGKKLARAARQSAEASGSPNPERP